MSTLSRFMFGTCALFGSFNCGAIYLHGADEQDAPTVAFRAAGVVYLESHAEGGRSGQVEFELNVRSYRWLLSTQFEHGSDASYGYDGTNFYKVVTDRLQGPSAGAVHSHYPVSSLPEMVKLLFFSFALNRAFDSGPSDRVPAPFIGAVGVSKWASYIYDEDIQWAEAAPRVPLMASFLLRQELFEREMADALTSGRPGEVERLSLVNVSTPAVYSVLNVYSNANLLIPNTFRLVHPIIDTSPSAATETRERRFWGEVTNWSSLDVEVTAPKLTESTSVQDLRLGQSTYQYYAKEKRWLTRDEVLAEGRLLVRAETSVSDLKHQKLAEGLGRLLTWILVVMFMSFPVYLLLNRRKRSLDVGNE